jgi:hypothetical protein
MDAQLRIGPRWHPAVEARVHGNTATGQITVPPEFAAEVGSWIAHPAVVDVATAFGVLLGSKPNSLYVPIGYDRVTRFADLAATSVVQAVREESSTDDVLRVDIALADADGNVALRIEGLALRPIDEPAALGLSDEAPATTAGHHRIPPILALSIEHGLRAVEGAEILDRVVASGRARVIASSLDLDDVAALLIAPPTESPTAAAGQVVGGGSIVESIRQMFGDLLGVADVGDDDDFFDIGGHSLIAIRLMSRIYKELGVRYQLSTIFEASTVGPIPTRWLLGWWHRDARDGAAAPGARGGSPLRRAVRQPAAGQGRAVTRGGDAQPARQHPSSRDRTVAPVHLDAREGLDQAVHPDQPGS